MKMKLHDYIKSLDEGTERIDINYIIFFQHERLVHLIVTFFTGIGTILFLLGFLAFENIPLLLLFLITLCLFVPYIFHYYYLENGIQRLYNLYFDIKKLL